MRLFFSFANVIFPQFELFADAIEDVLRIQFKALFDSMRGLSRSVTAEALALNMTFPYATFYDFEVYGKLAREMSGLETIEFSPFVGNDELRAFEAYANQHSDWITSSQQTEQDIEGTTAAVTNATTSGDVVVYEPFDMVPFIYDVVVDPQTGEQDIQPVVEGDGPFSPLWHFTPPPVSPFLIMTNTFKVSEDPHPQDGTKATHGESFSCFSSFALHAYMHSIDCLYASFLTPLLCFCFFLLFEKL